MHNKSKYGPVEISPSYSSWYIDPDDLADQQKQGLDFFYETCLTGENSYGLHIIHNAEGNVYQVFHEGKLIYSSEHVEWAREICEEIMMDDVFRNGPNF